MTKKQFKLVAVILVICLMTVILAACTVTNTRDDANENTEGTVIKYSVYPHLPDMNYYIQTIEEAWEALETGVSIEYSDYDCYVDGEPTDVDVIMYDAILLSQFIANDYLLPISDDEIENIDDFYPFTIRDQRTQGSLYGIPAFLCGTFLIYDQNKTDFDEVETISDLASEHDCVMLAYDKMKKYLFLESYVDINGDASFMQNATGDVFTGDCTSEEDPGYWVNMAYNVSIKDTISESKNQLAVKYEEDFADAYFGYSETMRFIDDRLKDTAIKTISFSDDDDTPLLYADMVGLTKNVSNEKRDMCLKLANLMASKEVLLNVSHVNGEPQFLLMPRISVNNELARESSLYGMLRDIASDDKNSLFRMGENYDQVMGN